MGWLAIYVLLPADLTLPSRDRRLAKTSPSLLSQLLNRAKKWEKTQQGQRQNIPLSWLELYEPSFESFKTRDSKRWDWRLYNWNYTLLRQKKETVLVLKASFLFIDTNAPCVLCSVYFSAQPNKLRPILKFEFGIPLNMCLSQLVRVCGKYICSHFCDFETLDTWFPLKYVPVSSPSSLNMPHHHHHHH